MSDDLIKRSDAIDEIEYELEMINSALDSITLDFNARERLRQRRGEAIEILNSIQQIPSADRPQGWIPCSERLPEEEQMVLTTIRGHDVIIPQEGETIEQAIKRIWNEVCYVSVGFIGSDGWYGADGYPQMVHPIAWMPLPKPWEGEDNE